MIRVLILFHIIIYGLIRGSSESNLKLRAAVPLRAVRPARIAVRPGASVRLTFPVYGRSAYGEASKPKRLRYCVCTELK